VFLIRKRKTKLRALIEKENTKVQAIPLKVSNAKVGHGIQVIRRKG
jgi:hypothetical protein